MDHKIGKFPFHELPPLMNLKQVSDAFEDMTHFFGHLMAKFGMRFQDELLGRGSGNAFERMCC